MKKSVIFLLCMLLVLPITAQDGTCTIDLNELQKNLIDAQTAANEGDTDLALEDMQNVVDGLLLIIESCETGLPLMSQIYDDGVVSFRYPTDWATYFDEDIGIYYMAASSEILDTLLYRTEDADVLLEGEILYVFVLEKAQLGFEGVEFDVFADFFFNQFNQENIDILGEIQDVTINDISTKKAIIPQVEPNVEMTIYLLDISDEVALSIGGISEQGELEAMQPLIEAFIATVQYSN